MSKDSRDRTVAAREMAAVSAFFALLAVGSTFPLVWRLRTHIASDAGDPLLVAWMLGWDADRIRHGFAGIWDAPNFFPYHHTLLYSEHLLGVAVFTAPLQWLTGNPIFVYNIAFLASQIGSALGMYVLGRRMTGRGDAALIAAVVFACQPFRASHSSHLQLLVLGWLPLSIWALHSYFESKQLRYLLAATAFYLVQALTSGYFAYYGLLPLILVAAYEFQTRGFPHHALGHLVLVGVLAALVMFPVIRAYADLRRESGLRRPLDEITSQSADVGDYASASPSLYVWGGIGSGRGEHELFPGGVAIVLGVLSLAGVRRGSDRGVIVLYGVIFVSAFVLSLGPAPRIFGHSIGISGPYRWLLSVTPGLDGLRVPARLAVIVYVALAVLAAFGSIPVFEWANRRSASLRWTVLVALALAIAAEGWASLGQPTFDYRGAPGEREAYDYLRSLPKGAAIELPTMAEKVLREFEYQYMTLIHGHRIVNGHSGYVTPLAVWLRGGHSPLRESGRQRDAVEMLRSLGVKYLVIHRLLYEDPSLFDEVMRVVNDDPQVIGHWTFGDTTVAALAPSELAVIAPSVTPIPSSSITARASDSSDRLPLLFDGDRDTRWLTGRPQAGDEWLELTFDRPRDVRVVRFQMGARSFGDYPRRLAIDVDGDGRIRTVFEGSVLPQLARGIVSDGEYPWIEVTLPENAATSLRLRETAAAHTFYWSIHELQVLGASEGTH
jgi:hypothetical protein